MAAVSEGEAIQLHGAEGMGRSTVLRHAARRLAGHDSGVVFLSGAGRDGEDLAQDIFEAC